MNKLYWIASAQVAYRAQRKQADGSEEFWKQDISGFYRLPSKSGSPIALIPIDMALADARPATDLATLGFRQPYLGYWYQSIVNEGDPNSLDPKRFAACCFPDNYEPGAYTFIVNENATVFKKDLGKRGGVDIFPADPFESGWKRANED